jgi:hypothetical protein
MKNASHLRPFEREHSFLNLVVTGRKNIIVNMETLKAISGDDTAEEIAQDVYQAEIDSVGIFGPFVTIHEPKIGSDGHWVVEKTLTPLGQQVYDSLQCGIFWDSQKNAKDFQASSKFYEEMIERGSIDMRFVDLIASNQDPEFKALKSKLVYFKMQGKKQDNRITNL